MLQKRRECEEKQCMKISFSNFTASREEIYESRLQLEKELFEKVLKSRENNKNISEGMVTSLGYFAGLYSFGYLSSYRKLFDGTPVRLKFAEAAALILKRMSAINGFLGLRSSGFVFIASILTSIAIYFKQDYYYSSYLMDSRHRSVDISR